MLAASCAEPPPREAVPHEDSGPIVFDFVSSFDPQNATREVREIDLGTPAARAHLGRGWSFDQSDDRRTWVWGRGRFSTLDVFVVEPRATSITFRCKPVPGEGLPEQRVAVFVNGEEVGKRAIPQGWREYEIATPASVWREGRNRLRFEYAYARTPGETGGADDDHRPLAVSWEWIRLGDADEQPEARPFADGNALVLPLSTQVDYYVDVPVGARLVIDPPQTRTPSGAMPPHRTEVVIQTTDPEVSEVHRIDGGAWIPLRAIEGTTARISFRAIPEPTWSSLPLGLVGWQALPRRSSVALPEPLIRADERLETETPDGTSARTRPHSRPNVLIYLIDTLRADHLGCYGYPRPVSPHIDRFAAGAIRFAQTFAQSSWTRSSVASLFTGLHPQTHRVTGRKHSLPAEARTLAEVLSGLGYETAAISTNPNVTPDFGFDQGFDHYETLPQTSRREILRLSDEVNEKAFRWLDERGDPERPFFLYLHSTDPHAPYTPREPWRSRFAPDAPAELGEIDAVQRISMARLPLADPEREALVDLYDAEIAFNDATFGALLEGLRERRLHEPTLIVLVSDHGEEFFEHGGWEHGSTLYEEQLHVPFLLRLPGGESAGRTTDTLAQLVDVMPTVLAALGEPLPDRIDGRNLLAALDAENPARTTGISHLELDGRRLEAMRTGDRKLIRWLPARPYSRVELYDLAADPEEQRDLSRTRPIEVGVLQSRLSELDAAGPAMETREIEPPQEIEEQLRALGYLQ